MAEIPTEKMGIQNGQGQTQASQTQAEQKKGKPNFRHSNAGANQPINAKKKSHFFGNMPDIKEAAYHSVKEIIEPRSKDIIFDVISSILESVIYPDPLTRPSRNPYRSSTSGNAYHWVNHQNQRTQYNRAHLNAQQYQQPAQNQPQVRQPTTKNMQLGIDDLVFKQRHEAAGILEKLESHLIEYPSVSVDYLYTELGEDAPNTAYCWGWKDLRAARIEQVGEEWWLVLPEVTRVN